MADKHVRISLHVKYDCPHKKNDTIDSLADKGLRWWGHVTSGTGEEESSLSNRSIHLEAYQLPNYCIVVYDITWRDFTTLETTVSIFLSFVATIVRLTVETEFSMRAAPC